MNNQPLSNAEVERIDYRHYVYQDDHDHDDDDDDNDNNDDRVSLSSESLRKYKSKKYFGADPRDCSSSASLPTDDDDECFYDNQSNQSNNNNNNNTNNNAAAANVNVNVNNTANQNQNHQHQRRIRCLRRRSSQMSDITCDSISETLLSESDLDDSSHMDDSLALLVTKRFASMDCGGNMDNNNGSNNANANANTHNHNTTIEEEGQQQHQHQQQQQHPQHHDHDHDRYPHNNSDASRRSGITTAATAPPTIPIRRGSKAPPTIPRRRISKDPTTIFSTTTTNNNNINKKEISTYLHRRTTIPRITAAMASSSNSKSNCRGNLDSPKMPRRTRSNSNKSLPSAASLSSSTTTSPTTQRQPIIASASPLLLPPPPPPPPPPIIESSAVRYSEISEITMEQSLLTYDRTSVSSGAACTPPPTTTTTTATITRTSSSPDGGMFVCATPPIRPQRRVSTISVPSLSDFLEEEDSDFEKDLLDALAEEVGKEEEEEEKKLPAAAAAVTATTDYQPTLPRIASFENIQELSAEISLSSLSLALSLSIPVKHTTDTNHPIPLRQGSGHFICKSSNIKSSSCPSTVESSSLFDDDLEYDLNK